jgi:hypothetical protein
MIESSPLVDFADPACALLARQRPELAGAVAAHYAEVAGIAGSGLAELCRARVQALVSGEDPVAAAGATSPLEQAALAFTDQFCHSALWVTDAQVDDLSRNLDPGRAFALVTAISLAERWYRLTRLLSAFAAA